MSEFWYEIPQFIRIFIVIFGSAALFLVVYEVLGWLYEKMGMLR